MWHQFWYHLITLHQEPVAPLKIICMVYVIVIVLKNNYRPQTKFKKVTFLHLSVNYFVLREVQVGNA